MNWTKLTEENLKKISKFSRKLANYYELFNWEWAWIWVPTRSDVYERIKRLVEELEQNPDAEYFSTWWLKVSFEEDVLIINFSKNCDLYL